MTVPHWPAQVEANKLEKERKAKVEQERAEREAAKRGQAVAVGCTASLATSPCYF